MFCPGMAVLSLHHQMAPQRRRQRFWRRQRRFWAAVLGTAFGFAATERQRRFSGAVPFSGKGTGSEKLSKFAETRVILVDLSVDFEWMLRVVSFLPIKDGNE